MNISDMVFGLAILSKYADTVDIDYVARSFPNGTPDHPSILYLFAELKDYVFNPVSEEDSLLLKALGWHSEQDGLYWVRNQWSLTTPLSKRIEVVVHQYDE